MNIFESFQPKKQRLVSGNVEETYAAAFVPPLPVVNSLKIFLLKMESDPFALSVSSDQLSQEADANDKAAKAKLTHVPIKTARSVHLSSIVPKNLTLYKQITIESNFDIEFLVNEYNVQKQPDVNCYIYPHNKRLSENYELMDFINRNLSKAVHWNTQESELPYFNASLQSNMIATASAGSNLMLGGAGAGAVNISQTAGPPEYEAALQAAKSRMLKWQDALFALLRTLYAPSVGNNSGNVSDGGFSVLGRSLLIPANTSSSAANCNGTIIALPYTSAVFYHCQKAHHSRADSDSCNDTGTFKTSSHPPAQQAPSTEPACMLIGVNKSTLARLHELGAQCSLVEDLAHPWAAANSTAPTSASGEINVNATRGHINKFTFLCVFAVLVCDMRLCYHIFVAFLLLPLTV